MGIGEGLVISRADGRKLSALEFQTLADVPPAIEWFANIENHNTRRAYQNDVNDFMRFAGIKQPDEFREVRRSHLIAWRKHLEGRALEPATIRRKLSAIVSLFEHLCEANAVLHNPADGVRRPSEGVNEGKSAALSDDQAKAILDASSSMTLKGLRDRVILSALLFHGLRRAELRGLAVEDIQSLRGVMHFRVHGKGAKIRYVPMHPQTQQRINDYLEHAGHKENLNVPLFRPARRNREEKDRPLAGNAVYKDVVKMACSPKIDPGAMRVGGA